MFGKLFHDRIAEILHVLTLAIGAVSTLEPLLPHLFGELPPREFPERLRRLPTLLVVEHLWVGLQVLERQCE